jgi:hypothetical protein
MYKAIKYIVFSIFLLNSFFGYAWTNVLLGGIPLNEIGLMTGLFCAIPLMVFACALHERAIPSILAIHEYLISVQRKQIKTTFSDITKLMPKSIHAITANRVLIKIIAFIWAIIYIIINSNN